ncbi:MAG: exo-alpha-sialidase [Bacilli bacterium]
MVPRWRKTWGKLTSTGLANPNSGTDALTLHDGRHILVYNHTQNWKMKPA